MRIAEYKQISTEVVETEILIPAVFEEDENGETVMVTPEHTEVVEKVIPIMGMVYRDATPEEEAEMARMQAEQESYEASREATTEERIEAQVMYTALMTDTLLEE